MSYGDEDGPDSRLQPGVLANDEDRMSLVLGIAQSESEAKTRGLVAMIGVVLKPMHQLEDAEK